MQLRLSNKDGAIKYFIVCKYEVKRKIEKIPFCKKKITVSVKSTKNQFFKRNEKMDSFFLKTPQIIWQKFHKDTIINKFLFSPPRLFF